MIEFRHIANMFVLDKRESVGTEIAVGDGEYQVVAGKLIQGCSDEARKNRANRKSVHRS